MKHLKRNTLYIFSYGIVFILNALMVNVPLRAMEQTAVIPTTAIETGDLTPEQKTQALLAQATNNVCPECGKKLISPSHLKAHVITHTGERPFKCDQCDKSFTKLYHLKRHKMTTHTGEKPYTCEECGIAFAQSNDRDRHELTHTGDKNYRCNICEKSFARSSALNNHKKIHSDEKSFICNECGQAFKQSSVLANHKKNMHKKRELPLSEKEEKTIKQHHVEKNDSTKILEIYTSEVVPAIRMIPEVKPSMPHYNPVDIPLLETPEIEPLTKEDLPFGSLEDLYPPQ